MKTTKINIELTGIVLFFVIFVFASGCASPELQDLPVLDSVVVQHDSMLIVDSIPDSVK